MLDTADSDTLDAMPGTWPAARNTIGMTDDMPAPRHAKPTSAATGAAATSATPNPTAATRPPARTSRTAPARPPPNPARADGAAGPPEPHRARAHDEAVAEDPPERHRHRERGEPER